MDGRMEIHPCVLQDIGPLGPLPKKVKCDRQTDGWTEERMDRWTNEQIDRRIDGWMDRQTNQQSGV